MSYSLARSPLRLPGSADRWINCYHPHLSRFSLCLLLHWSPVFNFGQFLVTCFLMIVRQLRSSRFLFVFAVFLSLFLSNWKEGPSDCSNNCTCHLRYPPQPQATVDLHDAVGGFWAQRQLSHLMTGVVPASESGVFIFFSICVCCLQVFWGCTKFAKDIVSWPFAGKKAVNCKRPVPQISSSQMLTFWNKTIQSSCMLKKKTDWSRPLNASNIFELNVFPQQQNFATGSLAQII